MSAYYLDTSVATHVVEGNPAVVPWFEDLAPTGSIVSSRLLKTELTRVLRRDGRPVASRDYVLDRIRLSPLDEAVLGYAESITEHAKTLDAIHLATAMQLGGDTVVVSHEANMLRLAEQLGLRTLDPVTGA